MAERPAVPETPQDSLKRAYASFSNLARKYGQESVEGGFTFLKYIPVLNSQKLRLY